MLEFVPHDGIEPPELNAKGVWGVIYDGVDVPHDVRPEAGVEPALMVNSDAGVLGSREEGLLSINFKVCTIWK